MHQLACYNWTEGDRLVVGDKKYILVDDAEWLHECYNLDKEEYGDVCSSQVEFL
jgi:hypothetical protein